MTPPVITFDEPRHAYTVNGEPVPSVTQVLKILQVGALPWWGMTTGIAGVAQLHRDGVPLPWDDEAAICKLLTAHKLTVNHRLKSAGTRGTSIHAALEAYCTDETVPQLSAFPAEDRGYVRALASALLELKPEPLRMEVVVGSAEHMFAGKYDLLARLQGRTVRLDAKTSKGIYEQAHLQLAAYELAAVECEEDPSDAQVALRLGVDGSWELVECAATPQMFLGVLAAYRALEALKGAQKAGKAQTRLAA